MDLSFLVWKIFVSSFESCSTSLFWRKDQTQHAQVAALTNLPIPLRSPPASLCTSDAGKDASVSFPSTGSWSPRNHLKLVMFVCLCAKMRRCGFSTCCQQLPPQQLLDYSCSKQLLLLPNHQRNCQEFAPCTSHRSVLQTHLHERWDLLTGRPGFFSVVCAMVMSSFCCSQSWLCDWNFVCQKLEKITC